MSAKRLAGSDFVKAVTEGKLNSQAKVTGLVKPSENENCILFCGKSDASTWSEIPARLIESGEQVGLISTKEGTFPLSNLQLNATSDTDLQALKEVLSQPVQLMQIGGTIGGIPTNAQLNQDGGIIIIGDGETTILASSGGGDVVGNGWVIVFNQGGDGVGNGHVILLAIARIQEP